VWWTELTLTLVVIFLMAVFVRVSRKLRGQVLMLERARERLETEERRVFDFLHTIGEALSADMRADDLNRVIVEGATQITEAHGGAAYLAQFKGRWSASRLRDFRGNCNFPASGGDWKNA
jgi:sigma-B regulation protein RsbU (phosphoserine phosphatase)